MGKAISVIAATSDPQVAAQLESLAEGTEIRILGTVVPARASLDQIARAKPAVVIVDGQGVEAECLAFTRALIASVPDARCVLLGARADVAVIARAVAAGVEGYLPARMTGREFVRSMAAVAAGTPPKDETAFTRIARAMEIPGGRPRRDGPPRTVTRAMRNTVSQCIKLGLTVPETASYVGLGEEQVRGCLGWASLINSVTDAVSPRRLAVAGLALAALPFVYRVAVSMASNEPYTIPVQGRVLYEDGTPLALGPCEVTFHPLHAAAGPGKRLGRAVADAATGEFRGACTDAKYPGLAPGEYKVTVRLPGQVPLPDHVLAAEYGDENKTPLRFAAVKGLFVAELPRPAELIKRWDRNGDGVIDEAERNALKLAVWGEVGRLGLGD